MTFVSSASRIGYGKETTFGTAASITKFLGITNQSVDAPDLKRETGNYRSFGSGRNFFLVKSKKHTYEASIPFIPTSGDFLNFVLGFDSVSPTTPNTPPYTHSLTMLNAPQLPSMTLGIGLERTTNNFLRTFTGGTVDSAAFSLAETGELNCTLGMKFNGEADHTTANATLFTQPSGAGKVPYMWYDRNAGVTVLGRTIARVKDFTFNVNNQLHEHYFLQSSSSQDPGLFTVGYPEFSCSMTIVPDGHLTTDSVYDLLNSATAETVATTTLPFYRSATDTLSFSFTGGLMLDANHNLEEDGNEIHVTANIQPGNFTATVIDATATY